MHKAVGASLISKLVKSLEKVFSPPQHLPEGVTACTGSNSAMTGLCLLCLSALLPLLVSSVQAVL